MTLIQTAVIVFSIIAGLFSINVAKEYASNKQPELNCDLTLDNGPLSKQCKDETK